MYGSDRFVELDPLQGVALNNAFLHYCHARQMDRALALAERCYELDPSSWVSAYTVAYVYLNRGSYDQALARLEDVRDQLSSTYAHSILAYLLAKVGSDSDFQDVVEGLEAQAARKEVNWTEVAVAYMGADRHEVALDYLEKAVDQWPPANNYTAWIGSLPMFDPLRDHPRFLQVLERLGLA